MARLILINGAPASGKSTLAKRYAADHPLALVLDIDEIRSMLGNWADQPTTAGLAARTLAIAMARTHLTNAHDVIVPQLLGQLGFVLELDQLCADVGATFVEIALLGDPDELIARFDQRSDAAATQVHRDAAKLVNQGGGEELLRQYQAAVREVARARPATSTIATAPGQVDQAYAELLAAVSRASTSQADQALD